MSKKLLLAGVVALSAGLILTGCTSQSSAKKPTTDKPVSINYSAAASLQGALTAIDKTYEKSHQNVKINFDFAGSGAIREKVVAGAPIDGVFLASKSDADKLTQAGKGADAKAVLGNTLVLVANKNTSVSSSKSLTDTLNSAKKIAIGEPSTVPAGMYAEQTLTKLGLATSLKSKLVMGSDVTQVLSYAAAGNVELGFVYKTDAMSNKNVKVVDNIPDDLHDAITYYTETVKDTKHSKEVKAFNKYLDSSAAQKVFAKYGFKSAK